MGLSDDAGSIDDVIFIRDDVVSLRVDPFASDVATAIDLGGAGDDRLIVGGLSYDRATDSISSVTSGVSGDSSVVINGAIASWDGDDAIRLLTDRDGGFFQRCDSGFGWCDRRGS